VTIGSVDKFPQPSTLNPQPSTLNSFIVLTLLSLALLLLPDHLIEQLCHHLTTLQLAPFPDKAFKKKLLGLAVKLCCSGLQGHVGSWGCDVMCYAA
jgi:hypothetical protein